MTKLVLNDVVSGYNLSLIEDNFDKIVTELQNKVLYRSNPTGEPNSMQNDIDLNGFSLINANKVNAQEVFIGGITVQDLIEGVAAGTIDPVTVDLRRFTFTNTVGGTTQITLTRPHTGSEEQLLVSRNGVVQDINQYTVVDTTHISFSLPLEVGEIVEIIYFNTIVGLEGPAGPAGPIGPAGPTGAQGPAGLGVPVGGTAGQVLTKNSGVDNDTVWLTPAAETAATTAFTPVGNIAATNVQAAIAEEITDLAASSGASLIGFVNTGTGAVARTVQAKLRDIASPEDFGAVGDGVADDTAAIQAAFISGKRITGNDGLIYRITNTITINQSNVTVDLGGSELLLDDATGLKDHIKLGDGITQRNNIILKNITFTRVQVATAGYAINTDLTGVIEVSGCRIFGNNEIFNGIRVYRGIIFNIRNNYIDNCINYGIYLEGTGLGANRTVDVSLQENRIEGGVTALYSWDFVEGLFCRDNIIFNTSGIGVSVNASSNANGLASFKLQDTDFDTCGSNGLFIDKVSNVQITDSWFSNNTGDDLRIGSTADGCIVASNQFYPNARGLFLEGLNCRVDGNLFSGGTTVIVLAATTTRASITSNTISNAQNAADFSTSSHTHFEGNHIYNMSVGTLLNTSASGLVIQDNKGDSAVGTSAFVTVGASPFTYTAGSRPEYVSVFAGTVSQIAFGANAISFQTNYGISLAPGQSVTITYSSIPFMVRALL